MNRREVWLEINQSAILNNLETIKNAVDDDTGIIAVVKANAYGHGLVNVAKLIADHGVDMLAVTSLDEGIELRRSGITRAILNLSFTDPLRAREAIENQIILTVYNLESAQLFNEQAKNLNRSIKVHLKIDTGMSRLGVLPSDVVEVFNQISDMRYLRLEGLYSHFADEDDEKFVDQQYQTMQSVLFALQRSEVSLPAVHMAKSNILFKAKKYHFDAVRPGIALYGYGLDKKLLPAMSFKTVLAQVKKIPAGSSVGYGQTYKADKDLLIGVIPVGYYHGYDRGLSNKAEVLVAGWRCPVIGRICMSQTIIDLSPVISAAKLSIGQEVVLIGTQGKQRIEAYSLAGWLGTNVYEVITRIPESVERLQTDMPI